MLVGAHVKFYFPDGTIKKVQLGGKLKGLISNGSRPREYNVSLGAGGVLSIPEAAQLNAWLREASMAVAV